MQEEKKEEIDEGIKVINTLSELIFPQVVHETERPAIETTEPVTESKAEETENLIEEDEDEEERTPAGPADNEAYIDGNPDQVPDFSDPIDIVTEHDDDLYSEAPEENEIPDEHDDLETEFIQHETEPLLQDIANQIMHLIEESTAAAEEENVETTTARDREELEEGAEGDEETIHANEKAQTEATEAEQVTELIDVHVSETSEAEKIESEQVEGNKNEHMEELTTIVDELINTPTEKPVETESSSNETAAAVAEAIVDSLPPTLTPVAVTEATVDATTQAIQELTSRTTIMEPDAEIASTIANFIHIRADEATTVSTLSSEATTKDTRRKFAQVQLAKLSPFTRFVSFRRKNSSS